MTDTLDASIASFGTLLASIASFETLLASNAPGVIMPQSLGFGQPPRGFAATALTRDRTAGGGKLEWQVAERTHCGCVINTITAIDFFPSIRAQYE